MRLTNRKAKRSNGVKAPKSITIFFCHKKAHKAQKISSDTLTHFFVPFVIFVPFVALLNREVFGLRMVDNNSRSRLFWLQLKLLAQLNADARRI